MKKLALVLLVLIFTFNAEARQKRPQGKVIDCVINSYGCQAMCDRRESQCESRCRMDFFYDDCVGKCTTEGLICKVSCGLNCGPMQY